MATWRRARVGKTTRSCDEVNEGLESRAEAPTSWATEFAEVENWLSVNLGFPKI